MLAKYMQRYVIGSVFSIYKSIIVALFVGAACEEFTHEKLKLDFDYKAVSIKEMSHIILI